MKTQDTVWYTRYKNLRDDLKSNIDRNKKSYLREYFQSILKTQKRHGTKLTKFSITRNQVVITYT